MAQSQRPLHVLALNGVYARGPDGRLVFHQDRPPTTEDVERLVEQVVEAAERMFAREGFGREEPDEEVEPDDALPLIQAASIARPPVEGASGRSGVAGAVDGVLAGSQGVGQGLLVLAVLAAPTFGTPFHPRPSEGWFTGASGAVLLASGEFVGGTPGIRIGGRL